MRESVALALLKNSPLTPRASQPAGQQPTPSTRSTLSENILASDKDGQGRKQAAEQQQMRDGNAAQVGWTLMDLRSEECTKTLERKVN